MSRRRTRRLLAGGMLTLMAALGVPVAATVSAHADEASVQGVWTTGELVAQEGDDAAAHITVDSDILPEPVTVSEAERPEQYALLRDEVEWLASREPDTSAPGEDERHRAYTAVLYTEDEPRHRFVLYPLADGGPRVHRPAEQPGDREVDEGWFFGRLSLPETLREVGVRLDATDPVTGQGGVGGEGPPTPEASASPESDPLAFLAEWREGMLLTAGVTVAVLLGTASVAFLMRRER